MALDDRDYMRERLKQRPADPWWKRIKPLPAIAIATALLPRTGSAEGTLRVNINTAALTELESTPGIGPKSLGECLPGNSAG